VIDDTLFELIANNTSDLICIHNREMKILYATPSSKKILGVHPSELVGRELIDFLSETYHRDMDASLFRRMLYRPGAEVKVMLERKDGQQIWVKSTLSEVLQMSGGEFLLTTTTEITESVFLMEDLILAWSKEKELSEMRSNLFTIASHEFKTPLAVIQMQVDLLNSWGLKNKGDERFTTMLAKIEKQIQRLNDIIGDLVQLRKINAGKEPFRPVSLDLTELFESLRTASGDLREGRTIELSYTGSKRNIQADESMMTYVLSNLLDNACKYSSPDTSVKLSANFGDDSVELSVSDQGRGIPEKDLNRIFEPFYRAENAMDTEGAGVALSIVKEFVVLHGGKITIESEEGKGTRMRVKLPYLLDRIS
jgi:PAS domain S-box-containing protein